MIPILLLGRSFLRQNRWLVLGFAAWPLIMSIFVWSPQHPANRAEVAEVLQQEIFYGIAVMAFLASSALYNEKRSRRVIGVLSKGVSRTQYLLGFLAGCACFAAVYFLSVGASQLWLLELSRPVLQGASILCFYGILACIWVSALALLCSVVMPTFLAAALAAAIAFAPMASPHVSAIIAPIPALINEMNSVQPSIRCSAIASAILESVFLAMLGARTFRARDVTVNVE